MAKIPGIRVFIVNPPAINIGGRFASGIYQFTLQTSDLKSLYETAPVLEAIRAVRSGMNSDLRISN
jgi:HAE1 family hydrophobic/amphiphilic exporter-1